MIDGDFFEERKNWRVMVLRNETFATHSHVHNLHVVIQFLFLQCQLHSGTRTCSIRMVRIYTNDIGSRRPERYLLALTPSTTSIY